MRCADARPVDGGRHERPHRLGRGGDLGRLRCRGHRARRAWRARSDSGAARRRKRRRHALLGRRRRVFFDRKRRRHALLRSGRQLFAHRKRRRSRRRVRRGFGSALECGQRSAWDEANGSESRCGLRRRGWRSGRSRRLDRRRRRLEIAGKRRGAWDDGGRRHEPHARLRCFGIRLLGLGGRRLRCRRQHRLELRVTYDSLFARTHEGPPKEPREHAPSASSVPRAPTPIRAGSRGYRSIGARESRSVRR